MAITDGMRKKASSLAIQRSVARRHLAHGLVVSVGPTSRRPWDAVETFIPLVWFFLFFFSLVHYFLCVWPICAGGEACYLLSTRYGAIQPKSQGAAIGLSFGARADMVFSVQPKVKAKVKMSEH